MNQLFKKISHIMLLAFVVFVVKTETAAASSVRLATSFTGIANNFTKMVGDVQTALNIIIPVTTGAVFIYYSWKKSLPTDDQGSDIDYGKRIRKTVMWGIIALLGANLVLMITGYFVKAT